MTEKQILFSETYKRSTRETSRMRSETHVISFSPQTVTITIQPRLRRSAEAKAIAKAAADRAAAQAAGYLSQQDLDDLPLSPTRASNAMRRGLASTGHPVNMYIPSPPKQADGKFIDTTYTGVEVLCVHSTPSAGPCVLLFRCGGVVWHVLVFGLGSGLGSAG